MTLLLNGVPQTLVFNTNGATRQLLATNTTPLATNVQYGATIIAVDANGNSATNSFGFDTIQTNSLWRDVKIYGAIGNGVDDGHGGHSIRHQRLSAKRVCLAAQRHFSFGNDLFEKQSDAVH